MHAPIHWLWRHAWGLYETHPGALTRRLFDTLDALHDLVRGTRWPWH
jgi:hypothetical protein